MQKSMDALPSLLSLSTHVEPIGGYIPVELRRKIAEAAAEESYYLDISVSWMDGGSDTRDKIIMQATLKDCKGNIAGITRESWQWMFDAWTRARDEMREHGMDDAVEKTIESHGYPGYSTSHPSDLFLSADRPTLVWMTTIVRAFTEDDRNKIKTCLAQADVALRDEGRLANYRWALFDLLDEKNKEIFNRIIDAKVQPWINAYVRGFKKGFDNSTMEATCARRVAERYARAGSPEHRFWDTARDVIFHPEPVSWATAANVASASSHSSLSCGSRWNCNLKLKFTVASVPSVQNNMNALQYLDFRNTRHLDGTEEERLALELLFAAGLALVDYTGENEDP